MERFGFIHDKLDIKRLILFNLGRLADAIDLHTLTELTLCDDGISYFDFVECVKELVETGHIKEEGNLYYITEKGLENSRITGNSVPFTVRRLAEKQTAALAGIQRRNAMIKTKKHPKEQGGFTVSLALSDGLGEILKMDIFAANEAQADAIMDGFTKRAEEIYGQVTAMLTE